VEESGVPQVRTDLNKERHSEVVNLSCSALTDICIPSAVVILAKGWFEHCAQWGRVMFEGSMVPDRRRSKHGRFRTVREKRPRAAISANVDGRI
jgi:hypothetical protein